MLQPHGKAAHISLSPVEAVLMSYWGIVRRKQRDLQEVMKR